MCNRIDSILENNPGKANTEKCECANKSDDWKTSGCCLASGKLEGEDLTGEGCLYPVSGEAGTNYAGKDDAASSGKPSIDVGKAIKAWTSNKDSAKSAQFMCPAQGTLIDEHQLFGRYEQLEGSTSHNVYIHTGNPRIRQDDASHSKAKIASSKVNGAGTEYFGATGWFLFFSSSFYMMTYIKSKLTPPQYRLQE